MPDYDLRFKDYDWMAYLAASGFDVYSMDIQGYGWLLHGSVIGVSRGMLHADADGEIRKVD